MARTLDLTPTWAGLMPALIALLQDGTAEGQKTAREELARLARGMDSANAAARSEEAAALARAQEAAADLKAAHARGMAEGAAAALAAVSEALDMGRACLGAYPPADLAPGIALGAVKLRGTARDLRDSLSGLVEALDKAAADLKGGN